MYEEYVPKIGDRVSIDCEYIKWIGSTKKRVHPGDIDMAGSVLEIVNVSSKHIVCMLECRVNWDNGLSGQYPMIFLKENK